MADETCCVCDQPAAHELGNRPYCDEHFEHALRHNRGLWRTGIASLIALVVFTAVVALGAELLPSDLSDAALTILGLVLAIVPAVLWLSYFYFQDRLEPEPHQYVAAVFLVSAILADVVGRRLLLELFDIETWLPINNTSALVGSILVIGFTLEFIKYVSVRYTIYPTNEFDERMDGIVYGTAAGLGVATMLNLRFILDSGGADLGLSVFHVVVSALAQGTFGGLTGYFLGEMKFIDEPHWWMPAGLALSAVLNGVFLWLVGEINAAGLDVAPVRGLVFAFVVAGLTFGGLSWLMRRAIARTLAADRGGSA
ncbi:MAG: PrsW family intramembrane metalloprotease [Anaerolineales bacterium]